MIDETPPTAPHRRTAFRSAHRSPLAALLVAGALLLAGAACVSTAPTPGPTPDAATTDSATAAGAEAARGERTVTLLAINDLYRIEGVDGGTRGGLARVRTLRAELEAAAGGPVLLLHAGDLLYPSLLSRMYDGAQMVSAMNLLDGDPAAFDDHLFVTLGNHEFDPGDLDEADLLDQRIEESAFYWFGTNVTFTHGGDGLPLVAAHNLLRTALVEVESGSGEPLRIGLFGLTIDTAHTAYVDSFADYEAAARSAVRELRDAGADVVVALTHLNAQDDALLLQALTGDAGPDLVIGGHDHRAMELPVDGRWVFKSDAEAVTARVVEITLPADGAPPRVVHRLVDLDASVPEEPAVKAKVAEWIALHDRQYCASQEPPQAPGCLATVIGHTRTELVGEETEIRGYETSLGNWVADQALAAFDEAAELPAAVDASLPRIALLNSGSLRLNQNVPAGPVEARILEELFAYPSPLVLLEIDGATVRRALERSVEGWSGGGWWLQVAGIAFRHNPQDGTVSDITLLNTTGGPRPLQDGERVLAVTGTYLVDPTLGDQDGYTMFNPQQVVARGPDLKQGVRTALAAAEPMGIAPSIEGRICNPVRPEPPCLALPPAAANR